MRRIFNLVMAVIALAIISLYPFPSIIAIAGFIGMKMLAAMSAGGGNGWYGPYISHHDDND